MTPEPGQERHLQLRVLPGPVQEPAHIRQALLPSALRFRLSALLRHGRPVPLPLHSVFPEQLPQAAPLHSALSPDLPQLPAADRFQPRAEESVPGAVQAVSQQPAAPPVSGRFRHSVPADFVQVLLFHRQAVFCRLQALF